METGKSGDKVNRMARGGMKERRVYGWIIEYRISRIERCAKTERSDMPQIEP